MRTARTVIAAASTLLVLGGCASAEDIAASDDSTDSTSETTDEPADDSTDEPTEEETEKPSTPVPNIGDCHKLSATAIAGGAVDAAEPAINCGKAHNAQTFYVTNPKGAVRQALEQGDLQKVYTKMVDRCSKQLRSWVSGDAARLARTGYGVIVGTAPAEDVALGATWVRCDVVLYDAKGSPVRLPKDTRGSLKKQTSDVDWCIKGKPKAKNTNIVLCREPHDLRSVGVVKLGKESDEYPGRKKVMKTMRPKCFAQTREFLGENLYTGWTVPVAANWSDGDRFGECYAKTKK
ncbi:MAG: septum formation family protein [Actinomycetia bacterium]|nr:septum formation family protein [Actinomycetes bacterium]